MKSKILTMLLNRNLDEIFEDPVDFVVCGLTTKQ